MMKRWMVLICFLCLVGAVSLAQTQQAAPRTESPADTSNGNGEEPDAPVAQPAKADKTSVEQETNTAWEMLKTALSDSKTTKARQARIDAVTAIGTLGDFEQAQKLLRDAARDPDRYLRFAVMAQWAPARRRYSFRI